MTDPNSIASALFNRRFAGISLSLIAVILAYGLLWRDAGNRLALRVDGLAQSLAGQDISLTIGQKQVRGFPYRLEVHLLDVTLAHDDRSYHLDELVIYASPLSLDHLVLDSGDRSGGRDAPFNLSLMGGRLLAKDARASLVGLGPDMRIAIDIKSARFQRDGADEADWLASRLQYHSRPDPQASARDHVVRIDGLNPMSGMGPRIDLFEVYAARRPNGMVEITDGTWVADTLPQKITGTFSLDAKGVIGGEIVVRPQDGAVRTLPLTNPSAWQTDFLKLMILP